MWPGQRRTYQQLAAAACARPAVAALSTAPSGYVQAFVPAPTAPAFPAMPPWKYGPILLDSGYRVRTGPAAMTGYIPAYYGDARLGHRPGGFSIGSAPIGALRPYHGTLTVQLAAGIGEMHIGRGPLGAAGFNTTGTP